MSKKTAKKEANEKFFLDSANLRIVEINLVPDEAAKSIIIKQNNLKELFGDCACSVPIKKTLEKKQGN
jgi:hypothetical protein